MAIARGEEPTAAAAVEAANLRRSVVMTDDRISGSAKNIGGQVEEGFGRATGDVKTQLQGKARQMEGTLQEVYGQAKETAAEAAEALRESAGDAGGVMSPHH